ncbi:MAG TPA: universal stress protein [Chitinophaga sp.]|uniref:universal stress protein n=1 Tax=Chitinophaga sp. TaxID=1869181 RepID=UPI002C53B8BC|nr:universal stress protein [Chitinophaga sp.]HVI43400.1 universal stress protein [Chitinophaga sp.]
MKKVIAAIDGLRYSTSTVEHALYITGQENVHLVGVFLDDITYRSYELSELVVDSEVSEQKIRELSDKDRRTRDRSIQQFELACQQARINYSVHDNRDIAIEALVHESIFADLVIIDTHESFDRVRGKAPSRFIQHLLADAACPLLLVPRVFRDITKIVMLYDGTPASVYAIRMLDCTLPTLKSLPVEVLTVKSPMSSLHLPDGRLMKEFMKRHYPHAVYTVQRGFPPEEIVASLKREQPGVMAVAGSYSRNKLSRWFYPGMADILIQELEIPLFVAHTA